MDGLELNILGPLEVWRDGALVPVPAARQRDLLVALGLRAGRAVPVERLVRLLWGDRPPATARGTLQSLVLRLRRLLVLDVLQTRPGAYLLAVEPDRLDAHRFETLLRSGRDALARGDYENSVRVLDEALALWRGPALSDVTSDELRLVEQRRLTELHQEVVESRIEARLAQGEHAAVVAELRGLVAAQPLRERPYEQLMIALYRDGRRAEALAAYQSLRQTLVDELGIEPGAIAQRLHQSILRGDAAPDRAPTAEAQPVPVPAQLPVEVAGFVGRSEQLAELDRCRDARLVAVVGTAGVGKTALAVRWAHQARERFPDGQLYVDLCGFSSVSALAPVDVLARFLRDLGVAPPQVPVDESEAAARYRSLLADRRLLVMLDNARDAAQVRSLLPGGSGCLTVVTSRDRLDPLVAREGATRVRLEPLAAGESQALLAQALGPARVADEAVAAGELAQLCAHLPLALRIAVAGMVRGRGGLAGYVARLRERGLDGLALASEPPVRATFDLSYAALAGAAQRLFRLLECVAGVDLTAESAAALAGIDRPTAHRLLDQLAAAHLLDEAGSDRFTCHDLLRDYAGGLAAGLPAAERGAAAGRLVGWYVAAAEAAADLVRPDRLRLPTVPVDAPVAPVFPVFWSQPHQAVAWLDAERRNLLLVAQHAAVHGPPAAAWRLAGCLPACFAQRGHVPELLAISRAALASAEAETDLIGQAAAHLALGTAHFARLHHEAMLVSFRQAAAFAEAAGWDEGQAAALSNLGNASQLAGRRAEAAAYYARALALQERLDLPLRQAATLVNIGNTRWELGELEEAVDYYQRAVALHRRAGSRTGILGITLSNLSSVLFELNRPDAALAHLTDALSIHQETGNQVSEAATLRTLAALHRDAGRYPQAAELADAARRLAREVGNRVVEAAAINILATIQRADGELSPALTRHREALELAHRSGNTHMVAEICLDIADICRTLGQPDLAASHAAQALTISRANDYRRLAQRAAALAGATAGATPTPAGADHGG